MSWLGRLRNPKHPAAAPQPNVVVIPGDIVSALASADEPLQVTVENALRSHLEERTRTIQHGAEELPFWLHREAGDRDAGERGEIDQSLRDRVSQRRSAEGQG